MEKEDNMNAQKTHTKKNSKVTQKSVKSPGKKENKNVKGKN